MAASYEVIVHRRSGAWLAGLAAVGLLGLSVFTCVVRAETVGEGYSLARCDAQRRSVERRVRAVNADILKRFAAFGDVAEAGAPPPDTDTGY
jgi:hypothetical protein